MKHFTFILLFLGLSAAASAQFHSMEAGIRGGYTSGLTFRVNIDADLSYEAQLCYRNQGTIVNMFRLKHKELGMDKHGNWDFIYGLGIHAGFYYTNSYRIFFKEIYYGDNQLFTPVIGVDGYLGIDYNMEMLPLSFGCSFQPHMELSLMQIFGINLWDFGIHVRYKF